MTHPLWTMHASCKPDSLVCKFGENGHKNKCSLVFSGLHWSVIFGFTPSWTSNSVWTAITFEYFWLYAQ